MILRLEYPWYSLHSSQLVRAVEIRFYCKASIMLLLKIITCIFSGIKTYSVDLAWKCGTAVCERLVVTSYSRRAAERGDVSTFLSAVGERMPCLSAAHCVALKSWRCGRSLEQSRVSSIWVEFCFRHHCSLKRTWLGNVHFVRARGSVGQSVSFRRVRCGTSQVPAQVYRTLFITGHHVLCLPRGTASKWHNL